MQKYNALASCSALQNHCNVMPSNYGHCSDEESEDGVYHHMLIFIVENFNVKIDTLQTLIGLESHAHGNFFLYIIHAYTKSFCVAV